MTEHSLAVIAERLARWSGVSDSRVAYVVRDGEWWICALMDDHRRFGCMGENPEAAIDAALKRWASADN